MKIMFRKIILWRIFAAILSSFQWYRMAHGGKWFHVHVDFPVCSCVWCDVPDDAEPGVYREGLWRGTPTVEVWP
jgi:hypothetical protein